MIRAMWSESNPDGAILGVELVVYQASLYEWGEPMTAIGGILPDFQGEEFGPAGFQTPHYISIWGVLEGHESLKYIKDWPRAAQLEAGRFLRKIWKARRSLRERGLLV